MSANGGNTTIVIFGASGDLTHRKLVPALYNLFRKDRLSEQFNIIGVSRTPFTDTKFRSELQTSVKEFSEDTFSEELWKPFSDHIGYIAGDAAQPNDLKRINLALNKLEGGASNRLYYLSVAPALYPVIIQNLGNLGMCEESEGWRRVIIEKPFGTDLASARELNNTVHRHFDESQVYRIDHYLGKETAQNVLFFRLP
jgi:glucose-6-phosphate 1-dehydrogenase